MTKLKSEFGPFGDGRGHTVTILMDGVELFQIKNPTAFEVEIDSTVARRQFAVGVYEDKMLYGDSVTKVKIEGQSVLDDKITFGGD